MSHILIQTHDIRNNIWVFSAIVEWLSITLLLYENIDVCNFSMKIYSLMLNLNKCNLRWKFATQYTNFFTIIYNWLCTCISRIWLHECFDLSMQLHLEIVAIFPTKLKRYEVIKATTTIKAQLLIRYNNKTEYRNITAWKFTQRCDHEIFSNLQHLFLKLMHWGY